MDRGMSAATLARYKDDWLTLRRLADEVVAMTLTCSFLAVFVVCGNTLFLYEVLVCLDMGDWKFAIVLCGYGLQLFLLFFMFCCSADTAAKVVS